jgi:hypothetical protein
MAFVDTTEDDRLPSFYNVSFSVGASATTGEVRNVIVWDDENKQYQSVTWENTSEAANHRDDVLLVQFLLKKVWQEHLDQTVTKLGPPPEPGSIAVDGWYGAITGRWISRFQAAMAQSGHNIAQDGRVDRAQGLSASISHTYYTICWLNLILREVDPDAFGSPTVENGWPPELIAAVMANTPGAGDSDAG